MTQKSLMKKFDVVVVGGGPAGGQCARILAKSGRKVLLIERFKDFTKNSFSSAGTPLETLEKFDLPQRVVGSFWNQLVIVTSNKRGVWKSEKTLGSVLDFTKLREFLAEDVTTHGGEVWMGCRYVSHRTEHDQTVVTIKNNLVGEKILVSTKVLVDATGPNRSLILQKGDLQPKFTTGTGVEYLIEVDEQSYRKNAEALTFFLGHKWIPKGYSWIFPMERNQLKVGAGIVNGEHRVVKETEPLKHYIELIIHDYIKPEFYKITDVHGATVKYSMGLNDVYSRDNLIAIGDTVSTINFLGGEGIRHAMLSSEIACRHIQEYLDNQRNDFDDYQKEMHQTFLAKWKVSEKLGMKKYLEDADSLVDKVVSYLEPMKLEDIIDVLFYYKFEKVSKGFLSYLLRKVRSFFKPSKKA
ncbi:NAD(P)/FAD-dependent oxidoreductase [Phormidesmis priestleyi]|uniref:NAD(P)/FAD-dependent oxidoreductase n=1 Tax=Phormidesmis priestleyi TaxID=268141 RepID=UPI0018D44EB6|nr:NAD(P)/FAD-dependent oxidoreductase [Phormidesmis priestleyi]